MAAGSGYFCTPKTITAYELLIGSSGIVTPPRSLSPADWTKALRPGLFSGCPDPAHGWDFRERRRSSLAARDTDDSSSSAVGDGGVGSQHFLCPPDRALMPSETISVDSMSARHPRALLEQPGGDGNQDGTPGNKQDLVIPGGESPLSTKASPH